MKCQNCGKNLPIGVGQCDNCGAAVDWKKYIWMTAVIAVATILLIVALGSVIARTPKKDPGESTGAPTVTTGDNSPSSQMTAPQTTAKPTETNAPPTTRPVETTQPTQPPTEPSEPVQTVTWQEYNQTPETYMVFRYYPGGEYDYGGKPFDTSELNNGDFYAVDDGVVYEINASYTPYWFTTCEHIYYAEKRSNEIYRSDLHGGDDVVIYTSQDGTVGGFQYVGTNSQGKLIILEDGSRIVLYDIATGATEVLMEAYYISGFTYVPYTIEDAQIMDQFGTDFVGSAIYWQGYLNEADNYLGGQKDYCCLLEADTQWVVETWEQDFSDPHLNGEAFIYQGYDPTWKDIADFSQCVTDHLYYVDKETWLVHLICEEPVRTYARTDTCVFFVKESEPEKLYAAYLFDLESQHLIYESASGPITGVKVGPSQYKNTAITFLENEQRLVWFDLATKTAKVLMEQYHIDYYEVSSRGYTYEGVWYADGSWWVFFDGKPTEDGKRTAYTYYCDTGELDEEDIL